MKDTCITVMDYNSNEVVTYVITHKVEDYDAWLLENTDHQPDEVYYMVSNCIPKITTYLRH